MTFLELKNGPQVAVRVCRSGYLVRKGRVWSLQASRGDHCYVTLIAGMNIENTDFEEFYVTGRLLNRNKTDISQDSDCLANAIHLTDLNGFCDAVLSRQWE